MPRDCDGIEFVVFVLIEPSGGAAAHFAHAQAEIANPVPNTFAARMWSEIANMIARLEPRQHASRHPRGQFLIR